MRTDRFSLSAQIPSTSDFAKVYRQYGPFAGGDGLFLFDLISSADALNRARVATLDLKLPAVAGIAKTCHDAVAQQNRVAWSGFVKQFIGAVTCSLMEANGFRKTGRKRRIPHKAFTVGEVYES